MTTPTSYLQTLTKDDAIAFVASLQKVKTHLSHALAEMSQQVQQKTVQLQGIETLLAEAAALKLAKVKTDATAPTIAIEPTSVEPIAPVELTTVAAIAASMATNGSSAIALPVKTTPASPDPASNGNVGSTSTAATASDVAPPPRAKSAQRKRKAQPTTPKSRAAVARQPTSTRKASSSARESTQPFVQKQFQEQSLTAAISDILKRSPTPLSADDIMAVLYEGLTGEAYKRAKNSVTNILSVGRGKEKWKSAGRGLYADHAVVRA